VDEALRNDADASAPQVGRKGPSEVVLRLEQDNAALRQQLAASRSGLGSAPGALRLFGNPELLPPLSGDLGNYFTSIARALVGSIAEACTIDVATAQGVQPFAAVHTDPSREPGLRDIERRELASDRGGARLRLPLVAGQHSLGVLTIWSAQGRTLQPSELASVHWVARLLSVLLDNRRLERTAEEATNAADSVLSMVSHEIRTPLATISMSLDTSMRRIEESADELPKGWLLQRLEKAKKAVLRTDRLIHTFLGVSMIQMGRLVPDVQDVDAAEVVTAAVHHVLDDLTWAGSKCTLQAPRPEFGRWDPVQLEVVITNLLTNSIKYAPGSDVSVRVDSDRETVVISVEDGGPGIAPEHQARLFQRFSRVPSTVRVHGFGLGLWIAKHFVEANGGTIELSSELGRGTRFVLRLPRAGA
jgi:signal transduction histidine kinase